MIPLQCRANSSVDPDQERKDVNERSKAKMKSTRVRGIRVTVAFRDLR